MPASGGLRGCLYAEDGVSKQDRADALAVLGRLGITARPKRMPRAMATTALDADRQKALDMLLREIQEAVERCQRLEQKEPA